MNHPLGGIPGPPATGGCRYCPWLMRRPLSARAPRAASTAFTAPRALVAPRASVAACAPRALAALALAAGCGARAAPRAPATPAAPPVAAAVPARDPHDPAPWPCAMRVLTWAPEGLPQVGELPWTPPASAPATPWFIEPSAPVDRAQLAQIAAAMRAQHIPGLSLRGQAIAPSLGELRALPDLRVLVLDDTDADGAALAAMDVTLSRIYLAHTAVDDAAVTALAARHPALEAIDLEGTRTGDAAARALAGLGGLRALNQSHTYLTDAGGAELRALSELEIVDLGHTRVGARTIAALRGLPIHELFLDGTRAGKEIATLAGLAPGLRRLDLSNLTAYKPTDADLAWLPGAPGLIELGLSASRVTDRLGVEIAKLPRLERLRLAGAPITLATIEPLAARATTPGAADLVELDLAETPIDDAHARRLIGAPRMAILRLDQTPITDDALADAEPGPALRELYVSRTAVGDRGLELLDRRPGFTGLGLGDTAIGAPTLARIARQAGLRVLVLSGTRAPREALAPLGQLRELESLYLDRTQAGDETIAALAPLGGLRVLFLASTDVSDASLPALRGLGRLEQLTLGDTRVGAAIADLEAWPRLTTLSLLGLPLGDAALPAIARRRSLVTLDLSSTEVHDPAPLAALPDLRLLGLAQLALSRPGLASAQALAARGVEIVR